MHFCDFCGYSNDAKCLKKTKIYPNSQPNERGERPRGKICNLCVRKFLIQKDVREVKDLFGAAKDSLENGLKRLAEKGQSAQESMEYKDIEADNTRKQIEGFKDEVQ